MHNLKALTAESMIYKKQKALYMRWKFQDFIIAIDFSYVQELVFLYFINLKHCIHCQINITDTANFEEIYALLLKFASQTISFLQSYIKPRLRFL